MKRVTLKDVAAKLGLSPAAVSFALRDSPKIPARTRERIQATCAELGYRQSPILSELGSSRWRSDQVAVGSIIAYILRTREGDPFERNLISPLQKQAETLGYQVEIFNRGEFRNSSKLQRVLRSRGITDVILGPTHENSMLVDLDWSKFICIQLRPGFVQLPLHSVVGDQFNTVILAWQKAVSYGYRRIGITLLAHPYQLKDDLARMSAVDACQKYLFPDLPVIPRFFHPLHTSGENKFIHWVKTNRLDVVIGFNETFYPVCRSEFGSKVPYATLHKGSFSNLSGIMDITEACGREGINLLHFCRRTHQWGFPRLRIDHVIEPTWSEGETMPKKLKS